MQSKDNNIQSYNSIDAILLKIKTHLVNNPNSISIQITDKNTNCIIDNISCDSNSNYVTVNNIQSKHRTDNTTIEIEKLKKEYELLTIKLAQLELQLKQLDNNNLSQNYYDIHPNNMEHYSDIIVHQQQNNHSIEVDSNNKCENNNSSRNNTDSINMDYNIFCFSTNMDDSTY